MLQPLHLPTGGAPAAGSVLSLPKGSVFAGYLAVNQGGQLDGVPLLPAAGGAVKQIGVG
ncbi:hypothetical protein ES703_77434 [subsurface metagenome]